MLVGLIRVFQGLPGAFMSSQVIFFSMVLGGNAVGVGSQIVEFSSFLM